MSQHVNRFGDSNKRIGNPSAPAARVSRDKLPAASYGERELKWDTKILVNPKQEQLSRKDKDIERIGKSIT
ncbi:MAG: hypothetical protein DCC75_11135 [Proteobacteria bacterium]|nr:MAG: hypothetical protein DCC75_11135 [Pseudomonadota bacterium]